jgi:hypothetical protein
MTDASVNGRRYRLPEHAIGIKVPASVPVRADEILE